MTGSDRKTAEEKGMPKRSWQKGDGSSRSQFLERAVSKSSLCLTCDVALQFIGGWAPAINVFFRYLFDMCKQRQLLPLDDK